ncbi:unnamed protein product [Eruca vesicaria subsp. sativa]|uniref:Uncharacterized protein n=1 Tax=Eruca vesicaria subsp. sativa TaxID=29727 RepID=A0ABC8KSZ3_ERUVS|nr:unnamed protein product [Eruca vesicaria subsp. sativa]
MASPSCSVRGEVAGELSSAPAKSSLPPPRPKSPPPYPDLYGKRREAARVQMLEREIGFLEARSQNAATPHVVAALVPNAVTGPAAHQTAVVARNRAAPAALAVHASEVVVVVLVRTCVVAYPPVSVVAVDHRVLIRRRAHVAVATARSNGHLVLNVLSYGFVVVFAILSSL